MITTTLINCASSGFFGLHGKLPLWLGQHRSDEQQSRLSSECSYGAFTEDDCHPLSNLPHFLPVLTCSDRVVTDTAARLGLARFCWDFYFIVIPRNSRLLF